MRKETFSEKRARFARALSEVDEFLRRDRAQARHRQQLESQRESRRKRKLRP